MRETEPFGDPSKARVLVIGHDPRLHKSKTIAKYPFFADHFLEPIPSRKPELSKYRLAESLFSYVGWLTSYKYSACELIITNLCNKALKSAPNGKTVLIPEERAREGLNNIRKILKHSRIEVILAMSQQVNYWLQKLGFYSSTEEYLEQSQPKSKAAEQGYYEPVGKSPFLQICGNKYLADGIPLFPVLHVQQYRLGRHKKGKYENACRDCIDSMKSLNAKPC